MDDNASLDRHIEEFEDLLRANSHPPLNGHVAAAVKAALVLMKREPLVQEVLALWARGWTNNGGKGGVTLDMVHAKLEAVRDFKLERE